MTGKYDPKALFQPAVMQPLASVCYHESDFSPLAQHVWRPGTTPLPAGSIWVPRSTAQSRAVARAMGPEDETAELVEQASFSITKLPKGLRTAMLDGWARIDDFVRATLGTFPVPTPQRAFEPRPVPGARVPPAPMRRDRRAPDGPKCRDCSEVGRDRLARLEAWMIAEDIHGSVRVNDSDGNCCGVFNRGEAKRATSAEKYPPAPLPWTEFTRFETASVSKMITTMMLLQFVQMGFADLDDSISHELPPFMNFDMYLKAGNDDITYRHLLQHRTGWANSLGYPIDHQTSTAQEFAKLFADSLQYAGTVFKTQGSVSDGLYGNANFKVLRLLIPNVTFNQWGKPGDKKVFWDAFLEDQIFLYVNYNWWMSYSFAKLSVGVNKAIGLGPVITAPNTASDAAAYVELNEPERPEGHYMPDVFSRAGSNGMRFSSNELGGLMAALRKGLILTPEMRSRSLNPYKMDPNQGRLGWSQQVSTKHGDCFGHGGWGWGSRTLLAYLADGTTVSMLTNRRGAIAGWTPGLLMTAVVDHWVEVTDEG